MEAGVTFRPMDRIPTIPFVGVGDLELLHLNNLFVCIRVTNALHLNNALIRINNSYTQYFITAYDLIIYASPNCSLTFKNNLELKPSPSNVPKNSNA